MPNSDAKAGPDPRLDALELYLSSLEESPEEALRKLKGHVDPRSVRRRLELMIQEELLDEACFLVDSLELDEEWADLAAVVLLRSGRDEEALGVVDSMRKGGADWRAGARSALAFVEEILSATNLAELTQARKERALTALEPELAVLTARGQTGSELEERIAGSGLALYEALEDGEALRELAQALERSKPIPLPLAQAALGGWLTAPPDLSSRLREEHPDSIEAQLLASAVDGELLGKHEKAMNSALRLEQEIKTPEHLIELGQLLMNLDRGSAGVAEEVSLRLFAEDEQLYALIQFMQHLRADETEEARQVLDAHEDKEDPHWLQARALYFFSTGDLTGASTALLDAVRLWPHPKLLRRAASAALASRQPIQASESLERLVLRQPDNIEARLDLATAYWESQEFENAADQFRALSELEPEVETHRLNQALCLMQLGNAKRALQVFDQFFAAKADLAAILHKTQLLRSMARSSEAFAFLSGFRRRYWDNPRFLMAYITVGYAAEEEVSANDAMLKLLEMQESDQLPATALQKVSVEQFKRHAEGFRKHKEDLYDRLLRCRIPWLMVDRELGHTPYWAWAVRTQRVRWLPEDQETRASFSIPSTNSFTGKLDQNGKSTLTLIEPPRDQEFVADYTSLITLQRLGLIDEAIRYAGTLVLPVSYRVELINQRASLFHHQPSRASSVQAVKDALDREDIRVLSRHPDRATPLVDEYTWNPEAALGILDLLEPLHATGQIPDDVYDGISQRPLRKSMKPDPAERLERGSEIQVNLETLRSLATDQVLDLVLNYYTVFITDGDRRALHSELIAHDLGGQLVDWHDQLWEELATREDVSFRADQTLSDKEVEPTDSAPDPLLAAFRLADREGIPLLADDRVLQAVLLNEKEAEQFAAFGTDALIQGMLTSSLISLPEATDATLRLIEWRYRFLLVSPEILRELAARFANQPPGRPLRSVASYLHDCMADPALLGGMEKGVDPPISMAHKYFLSWVTALAEFLVDIWVDDRFSDQARTKLSGWVCNEFLPCPPSVLGPAARPLGERLNRYLLARATLRSGQHTNRDAMNSALRSLANGLGIDSVEYQRIVVSVIEKQRTHS